MNYKVMAHIKRESKIWYTPKKRNSKITYDYFRSLKIEKKKKKKKKEEESTVAEMRLGTKLSLKFHCKFHP